MVCGKSANEWGLLIGNIASLKSHKNNCEMTPCWLGETWIDLLHREGPALLSVIMKAELDVSLSVTPTKWQDRAGPRGGERSYSNLGVAHILGQGA